MRLVRYAEWCEHSTVGLTIRQSVWLFPTIEAVHLLALAGVAGAILLVDLRMCGLGLRRRPLLELVRDMQPLLVLSIVTMGISGILLFFSEATKLYYSPVFRLKMLFLVVACLFTFGVRNRVAISDEAYVAPATRIAVGLVSIALWLGVGISGRAIGFY